MDNLLVEIPCPVWGVKCQTACKPGSVRALRRGAAIPLGRALLRASRDQPGRRGGNAPASTKRHRRLARRPPLFGLAPGGVCPAAPVARRAVRFYRPVSPLPAAGEPALRAVCFLWHFPWGHPRRPLAGTAIPWSPDFPPPGNIPSSGCPAVWHGAGVANWGRGVNWMALWIAM